MYMGYDPSEDDKNELVLPTADSLRRTYSDNVKKQNKLKVIRNIIHEGESGGTFCELSVDDYDCDNDYDLWKDFPDGFRDELITKGYRIDTKSRPHKLCIWWGNNNPYECEEVYV